MKFEYVKNYVEIKNNKKELPAKIAKNGAVLTQAGFRRILSANF